jgi:fructose-1,6-bisphosphatase/inositol monophosphatase family enzyme
MAASVLIAREAGCTIMDPDRQEFNLLHRRILVSATPELAEQVLPHLKNVPYESD